MWAQAPHRETPPLTCAATAFVAKAEPFLAVPLRAGVHAGAVQGQDHLARVHHQADLQVHNTDRVLDMADGARFYLCFGFLGRAHHKGHHGQRPAAGAGGDGEPLCQLLHR